MNRPKEIKNRKFIDPKLGIKSSLGEIRNTIAALYVFFLANGKRYVCHYSVQKGSEIAISDELVKDINQLYKDDATEIIRLLEKSPLFKSQFESIYVFMSLIYSLGTIRFNDRMSDSSERTGSKRYAKSIGFSANMLILDAVLSSYSKNDIYDFIHCWLDNRANSNTDLDTKVRLVLQIFSERTVYKLRSENANDLILQNECIYDAINNEKEKVNIETSETVGPFRIIKSGLEQGLHPYILSGNNTVSIKPDVSFNDFQNYRDMVSTLLDLERRDFIIQKNVIQDETCTNRIETISLQQIYYGAPGTGKSYRVKCETADWEKRGRVVRTTFHPDSDYSTFVGCYKPTAQSVPRYDIYNNPVKDADENVVMEKVITYEFVPQAFLQAYIAAWTKRDTPEYLIIEEINRGNCAQIFGDLFQLLDRGDDGYSEYAIRADKDLQKHLEEAFKDMEIPDYPKVKLGEELLLPPNLYIRATMNTSDQSLFPIDSAFKRRWDWQYVPIAKDGSKDWKIEADGRMYDWWQFLETINKIVFNTTNSEDKQLGYYFCKANKDGIIGADTFVSKVIFYLWNDVFKDYGFDNPIFNDESGKLSFDKFFSSTGEVVAGKVVRFLDNLEVECVEKEEKLTIEEEEIEEGEDAEDAASTGHDYSVYSINGKGRYKKAHVAKEVMELYVVNHPNYSEEEIANEWSQIKSPGSKLVYTSEGYNSYLNNPQGNQESRIKRYIPINLPNGGKVYVTNQFSLKNINSFIKSIEELGWSYRIEKLSE